MMRISTRSFALILLTFFSFTVNAVNLSRDATGQVLLYPYYNVNQGNVTFVSVTNTTAVAKAVKVRFREGVGGESVFDFTLYLSPRDVWVGAVSQQSGAVRLSVPADTSCTIPATLASADFSAARIDSAYDPDDSGTQSSAEVLERLSEGHIEIIELAELPSTTDANEITAAITHRQFATPVTPIDCTVAVSFNDTVDLGAILDAGSVTASGVTQDFQSPGGGLIGNAAIFNATSGIYFPYNATALRAFASNPIWWPQNSEVFTHVEGVATSGEDSAGNAISNYRTADEGTSVPSAGGTLNIDLPDLSTPSMAEVTADSSAYMAFSHATTGGELVINSGSFGGSVPDAKYDKASAVGAALTANRIMGEYINSGDYGTEWIVTFPTRYTKVSNSKADAPFTTTETASSGMACENMLIDYWDREEQKNSESFIMGPEPNQIRFCYAANVLSPYLTTSFDTIDVVYSKAAKLTFSLEYDDGWGYVDMSRRSVTPTLFNAGDPGGELLGLPLIGFIAVADTVTGTERGGVFPLRVMADEQ
ncbi:MAG: hypothetical protein AB2817_05350 [Candidatus Thiodiazotropha sp.]|nr:MAG: hypothetical protein DBO99_03815 [gamma proteobacterium symbiont of Ctena orbiculata]